MMRNIQDKVSFPGYLVGNEKVENLLASDVFVFPSFSEGCPVALLEAMGAGLPVITTPVGGIPDIFIDGKNGVLLKSVEPEDIAEAIERLLSNEELCRVTGEHNRREAWEKYEARIVCKKITQKLCLQKSE